MAWLFKSDWVSNPRNPVLTDLDNISRDIRTWGGNVDAAGNSLTNLGGLYTNAGTSTGIGTNTPAYTLDVKAVAANVAARFAGGATGSSNNCQIRIAGTKDGELWMFGPDTISGSGAKDLYFIDLANAGTPVLALIQGTGRVGIGTATPGSKLAVIGLPVYASNSAAIAGGLTAGDCYRTGANPDQVCIVH